MDSNFSGSPNKKGSDQRQSEQEARLVLHNDDVHSFDFVMSALEDVCSHSMIQAEQCAMITHYKGRCEILVGEQSELKEKRLRLISRGLKVTIE